VYVQHGREPWVNSVCGRYERCTPHFACETWNEGRNLKSSAQIVGTYLHGS